MARRKVHFLCGSCGAVQPKWMGKCPECGAWDALQEYREPAEDPRRGPEEVPAEVERVAASGTAPVRRVASGIGEWDRVLGGGMVPGSVVLVGGEPGIGKSTLLLQAAAAVSAGGSGVLYASSEESAEQVRLRAGRLGGAGRPSEALLVLAEGNLARVGEAVRRHKPAVLVVDSIQMAYKPEIPAAPGSVTQLRDCTLELTALAKTTGTVVVLVGHVTKQGVLAGPKLLEHIVDTVVYFEGDRYHAHRIIRCAKNRFGSTHEVGLFRMTGSGLEEVTSPESLFLEHYAGGNPPSGSVVTAAMSGTRVLLVEVQALTAASVIGAARRKVSGVSSDRLAMIIAVLEKRGGLRLAAEDVYVSATGGVRLVEPGVDLAIAVAIASAHVNRALPAGTLVVGELGLGGEVRPVAQVEQRLREAARFGISHAVVPPLPGAGAIPRLGGLSLREVRRLSEALDAI